MSYSPHIFGIVSSGVSQAGKFVLTNSNGDVEFPYGDKVQFGNDVELQVYHDGLHSYITSSSGLKIGTESSVPITIGNSTSEVTVADNLTVTGDFTVNGTTTTVNSTTVTIDDKIFNIAADQGDSATCDSAGITVGDGTEGANASILYKDVGTGQWELNKNLNVVGTITGDTSLTLDAVTITTAEIGVLDGVTLGTAAASKVMTWDGSSNWTAAGGTCANLGTVTTADIDGGTWQGTIDGTWTAADETCSNLGTVSAATSITSTAFVGPLDGVVGGNTPASGTFTSLDCTDNSFAIDNLDVNGGTNLASLADTDLIIVDDNADDAVNKCTIGVLKSYVSGGALSRSDVTSSASISSDVTLANAGAGAIVLKLPSVSTYENNDYVVKKTDATAYTVTIQPADADSSANVDSGSNIILYHQHESNTFFSDGTHWHVI